MNKLIALAQLMRLERPVGTLLLAWSTLWGLWLAGAGRPPAPIVLILLLGTLATRSLGCVLNDLADRHYDSLVERTRQRPLARGAVQVWEALLLALALAGLCLLLVLQLNRASQLFAVFCLAISAFYPLCKRFFPTPQLVLGLAFAAPILMAQTAIHGTIDGSAWLLYLASTVWALIYDTFYGLVDRDDDLKIGLRSAAIWARGWERRFFLTMMGLMLALLLIFARVAGLNGYFYLGIGAAALCFGWQLHSTRSLDRDRCFRAFVHNNWVGASIWAGLVLNYL